MANFASIAEIEAFLQIPISEPLQIISANRALMEATAAIKNYCRQLIERVSGDNIVIDVKGGKWIFLPELPVLSVSSVIENNILLTPITDYKFGEHGTLYRMNRHWYKGIGILNITYTHGWAVIPDDIVAVCTRAASRVYQAGLKSKTVQGVPGISSEQLGDYSVAFSAETSGGNDVSLMGASAARMLSLSEKDILDKYRI